MVLMEIVGVYQISAIVYPLLLLLLLDILDKNMKMNMRVLVPQSRQEIYSFSKSFGFAIFRCKKTSDGLVWSSHGSYGGFPTSFCYSLSSSPLSPFSGHSR